MQNRAKIAGPDAVSALNVIDVVYCDSQDVRDAWRHFKAATVVDPISVEKIVERYLSLVEKMSRDLGLSRSISVADIESSYYPKALGHMDEAAYWEAQDKIRRDKSPDPKPEGGLG
jgi:hypothetical protein